ncbi:hypothetical protein Gpo141_00000167 [Globisporangium polare]
MKSFAVVAIASLAVLAATSTSAHAAVVVAKDCTQSERQLINKLLEQDVNPAKACYSKAKGDITTLSTSRLCPIAECATWLEYMAENAPDCVYDDTNYGTSFKAKAKDCSSTSSSGSVASDADSSKTGTTTTKTPSTSASSSAGSSAEAGVVVTKTKAPAATSGGSKATGSGSSAEDTTIDVPIINNSTISEPTATTTPKSTTIAPVTPSPTKSAASSSFSSAVGALCAVSLSLAVLAF